MAESRTPSPRAAAPHASTAHDTLLADALLADAPGSAPRRVSRRAALRAGGLAVAAAALAPAPASAATDEGGLLLGLWRREMGASLAYDRVAHVDPVLTTFRGHEADHAAALATQLAAVGLGTPQEPLGAADLDVTAELLARSDARGAIAAATALEQELVALYRQALTALPDAKIAMTAATILASHSQHLLILRRHTDDR